MPTVYNVQIDELTQLEEIDLASGMIDGTTVSILKRQRCQGIIIASSQRKLTLYILILYILNALTDKIHQTNSEGHSNC